MKPVIRHLQSIEEYKQIPAIEKDAWGFDDLETEPHHLITRVDKYGGLVRGLFLADTMIGFSYALVAHWEGENFLYSHMAAVIKTFQGLGYGYLLKADQRRTALEMGYRTIRWNFDPLESLNTYFNLHRLGAISREYERNIYGVGESGLHRGLNTDRLIAEWNLESTHVETAMQEKTEAEIIDRVPAVERWDRQVTFVEIPRNIRAIKEHSLAAARDWRRRTRQQFEHAFQSGYIADSITLMSEDERIFIRLSKEEKV